MTPPAKKAVPTLEELTEKGNENKGKDDAPVETTAQENGSDVENKEDEKEDEKETPRLSENVVSTVPNKTPSELAAETPDETAARYGIDQKITDEDAENPRVQVYRDTYIKQVPSGTHLHPDVAKDLNNRGISENTTDSAQVKRTITDTYDFAGDAENNDKF